MAGLADDWEENQQTCVDVLCAYLRMSYAPDPGDEAPEPMRLAFRADREVRHTAIRVITAHLRDGAKPSWQGLNFDFTGVVFDGGDFSRATFSGGAVSFSGAEFSGGAVSFSGARFSGGAVSFVDARFSGGTVSFPSAEFSGGEVSFTSAEFSGGNVSFSGAEFSGGEVYFQGGRFSGSTVSFSGAEFSSGTVYFQGVRFSGGTVSFYRAEFSGGTLSFRETSDWSSSPVFPWADAPPPGVMLLEKEDQSQA
jgi:Pentapeptide repeats (9 copies)